MAPASNVAVAAIELGANLRPGQSLGPQQNQTGRSRLHGASVPYTRVPLQVFAFACAQCHRALHGHDDTLIKRYSPQWVLFTQTNETNKRLLPIHVIRFPRYGFENEVRTELAESISVLRGLLAHGAAEEFG